MPDKFVVRYTSLVGSLWKPSLLIVLFWGVALACLEVPLLHGALQGDANEGRGPAPEIAALLFGGLGALVAVEILAAAVKILSGRPALIIDHNGIKGYHLWLPKYIAWSDYKTIYRQGNYLFINTKESRLRSEAGKYGRMALDVIHVESHITVPLTGVDKSEAEIMAAISHFAGQQAGYYYPSAQADFG